MDYIISNESTKKETSRSLGILCQKFIMLFMVAEVYLLFNLPLNIFFSYICLLFFLPSEKNSPPLLVIICTEQFFSYQSILDFTVYLPSQWAKLPKKNSQKECFC